MSRLPRLSYRAAGHRCPVVLSPTRGGMLFGLPDPQPGWWVAAATEHHCHCRASSLSAVRQPAPQNPAVGTAQRLRFLSAKAGEERLNLAARWFPPTSAVPWPIEALHWLDDTSPAPVDMFGLNRRAAVLSHQTAERRGAARLVLELPPGRRARTRRDHRRSIAPSAPALTKGILPSWLRWVSEEDAGEA